jgi:pyridoxine 5'-phosphate synthase PdxJ
LVVAVVVEVEVVASEEAEEVVEEVRPEDSVVVPEVRIIFVLSIFSDIGVSTIVNT